MKKVLAIVYDSPAHLDFGGDGYFDLLKKELSCGSVVDLIVSEKPTDRGNVLKKEELPFNFLNSMKKVYLSGNYKFSNKVVESIQWLNEIISIGHYDEIYIDRICSYAQVSMEISNVSTYHAVGTAGIHWGYKKSFAFGKKILLPCKKKNNDLAMASSYFNLPLREFNFSHWVYSRKNAIHFLPEIWYESQNKLPNNCITNNLDNIKNLLVTYGNSMPAVTVKQLIAAVRKIKLVNPNIEIKILTGTEEFHNLTLASLNNLEVTIEKWGSYSEEFTWAHYVIGHGGTSHIFNCIKYQALPICIPAIADQFYNAQRAVTLNIGYSIFMYKWWRKPFNFIGKTSIFSAQAINDILNNKGQYLSKISALKALSANLKK
ncbi:hypothetical protein BK026_08415 [Alteromonas sp. V450]|uniref:glycosyltransferase n=1 Tax=Alteromonas sp. V450 TaxID=1912139 RepID=UPI0008FF5977|nr:glycosyltransferase [Alteromonas sp. V450]OJF68811.1 hypothetical protein BK026_08415 [Alteromonas sp. V450]